MKTLIELRSLLETHDRPFLAMNRDYRIVGVNQALKRPAVSIMRMWLANPVTRPVTVTTNIAENTAKNVQTGMSAIIHYEMLGALNTRLTSLAITKRTKLIVVTFTALIARAMEMSVYGTGFFLPATYDEGI